MNKKTSILAFGILLFLLSLALDRNISSIAALMQNPAFDVVFGWFTDFINVFVILILITTLFLFEEKKREWIFPLWLSFALSVSASFLLKLIVARPRPSVDLISSLFNALNFSFPSMHAMVAFAAAPILDREFPKLKWFWIVFAVLVAFSRVYFNFHFLSDVIFGAFAGYFIGVFVIYLEEKYKPFKFLK
ncbi:phosphatase PAP2 family protein [Candidatus Woesearchaeota archaeon]|nr:phosphatase PAP2 family protein [Candidatus Woesearchaeota archaeon]